MTIDYAAVPSPCFVLDEARLRANLELLARVQRESGAKKGFAMRGSFPLVREYLPGVAASSLSEARLGHEEFGGEVHAYSPAYIPEDFDDVAAVSTHVTFNSLSEFERFASRLGKASAGLRINPEYAEVETDLYNPCVPGSRLGVMADKLAGGLPAGVEGLHFHTLCEKGSDTLERTVERVEAHFGPLLDQVRWLNMGGGHAITREGYDVERLIGIVQGLRARHPNVEQIILEPGSAVGWQTGELVSTVLDIVENGGVRSAMLDVSFAAHMPVIGASSEGGEGHRYHLGGQTCLAGDFMPDYVFAEPLKVGDRVVFLDMMHYTMVKTTTFNGVRLPSIAIWRERGELEVLSRFGYEDYKSRL